jgi:hypothetical protein
MRRSASFLLVLLAASPVSAETMLEQARQRGAASAEDFEDDPTTALPQVPWFTETRTSRLLGLDVELSRLGGASYGRREFGLAAAGHVFHSKLEQPLSAGLWGQSWAIALTTEFGADSRGLLGYGAAMGQFGTLATLNACGHAIFFRFSGELSMAGDVDDTLGRGFASIPIGVRFRFRGSALELGAEPALGWINLVRDSQPYAAGPLFIGGHVKWQTEAGWFELQQRRGVSPAHADDTELLACTHAGVVSLCAEGDVVRLRDLSSGDTARFARVGVRFGLGQWASETQQSQRPLVVPLR